MDYEKKYKELVAKIKNAHLYAQTDSTKNVLEGILPELAESEDERIRKEIIETFKILGDGKIPVDINYTDISTWLEKQGEQKSIWHNEDEEPQRGSLILLIMQSGTPIVAKIIEPNHTFNHGERWAYIDDLLKKQGEQKEMLCDKCKKEQPSHSCQDITALGGCAVEHEQKSDDKVEAKIHEGDWVVTSYGKVNQVIAVDEDCDGFTLDDYTYFSGSWKDGYHLWTIKDAKDGDVLCTYECYEPKIVFILKGTPKKHYALSYHCYYNIMYPHFASDSEKGCLAPNDEDVKPATKEQRDLLFQKMKEAGFEWNPEKKGLKKISQRMVSAEAKEALYDKPINQ